MEKRYLKPTVKAEPLIWQWYAWPYLIPPLPAACNIVERHLKIMQSYVQNPQIHAQAVKDPKLLGGPFIDLEGKRIDEVKVLIDQTKKECGSLIELHDSFKELDKALQTEAQGDSLDSYYNRTPTSLKGLIEFVYDLNNHPSVRLIEPLIYKKYYLPQHQKIALSDTTSDFRKFVLSTPRLDQDDEVYLNIPFSDPKLDHLFRMREDPQSLDKIQDLFEIPQSKQQLFQSFFTTTPPTIPEDRHYQGEGIRIRYFGHACVLVQTKSVALLFDPVISYPLQANEVPRYTLADIPDYIDYVVITHNHQDHLMFETLLQLRHKIGHIIFPANHGGALEDPSIKLILKHTGFTSLIELREMDTLPLDVGEIIALPFLGEHSDLNIQSKLSYCVQLKGKRFLFAADSNNLESSLYDHIFDHIGSIDMLFLGMECDGAPLTWLYGPLLTSPLKRSHDRNRTLSGSNFEKAWAIAEKSTCKQAYVYAMGQEPWLNYVMALKYSPESPQIVESNKFIEACKQKGIESERLFGKKEWIVS
ncbi:MAG: MBL fold metallo-hydrolase [Alphaproteobacteria bacterium]|nr:MBL fold metallo-hydrolase [Alphaproteobacteria bacterium]MBP9777346.1 MBL fold metallo-hydrolase [Alphaproteobacteria bacterium]